MGKDDQVLDESAMEDRTKRDRDIPDSQPEKDDANHKGTRPNKARKVMQDDNDKHEEDDPVAQARKALEMFRKEMEGDLDYDDANEEKSNGSAAQPAAAPNKTNGSNGNHGKLDPGSRRWQKAARKPMISQEDDPCLL
jgi:hypothetical protein